MAEAGRTQTYRQVSIGTPLGEDVLLFRHATIVEHLGRLFHMEVDVFTDTGEIEFKKIVGHNVTIRLEQQDGSQRFFNGFVTRIIHTGGTERVAHYRMTVSPWTWFLTRTSDCRIWQEKAVPDIIQEIFRERGFTDFSTDGLQGSYSEREYCVQYRETDFAFISRLMEEEGIYYFFKHEDGKHTLMLVDSSASHEAYTGYDTLPFFPPTDASRDQEYMWEWHVEQEVQPGKYAVTDYFFEKPGEELGEMAVKTRDHAVPDFEMFDYHPGRYRTPGEASTLSKNRLDEFQANHEVIRAKGDLRGTACGCTFKADGLSSEAHNNKEYLITSVVHQIESDEYSSSAEGDSGGPIYESTFTCILATQQFRPRRITPRPVVYGPQTAFVTGPSGEEIHTDKYGRIKVQFHWDRYAAGDDTTSCWVRVGQMWASKKWGGVYLPRVGMEVIVSFLEGDPDQPLVTGCVYNADTMPPYGLPDNKTMSGIKTNSSKGGAGFNEIRFEDKAGEEQIFIHAQKNSDTRVLNDCFEWIGNDRHLVVINDQIEEIKHDRHEKIGNTHTEEIVKDRNVKVGGKEAIEVTETHSMTVKGDVIEVFKANHSESTTADYYLVADNICIEGKTNITIKVGENYIAIDQTGLKIGTAGQMVLESKATLDIKGTAPTTLKSDATLECGSPATTVKGDATLVLKGGTVAIN
jgi:type VI secretion system secreted protein VgrG